jgi:hypothetical protein
MADLAGIGRLLIVAGLALAAVGVLVWLAGRTSTFSWLGRLPGDFVFRRGSVTIAVPLLTSLILSVILTIALNLVFRR